MTSDGKITVLYICGSDFSGAEKSLLDLISAVATVVYPIVLVPHIGETYNIFTGKGIQCICHRYTDAWVPSNYLKNVIFHPWRLMVIKNIRYNVPCVRFVKKALKGQQIDLIHTNYSLSSFGVFLAREMIRPHVWHIREYLDKAYLNGKIYLGRNWLRKNINGASARIVVSNACREFWRLKQENTYTINNAVLSESECCYVKEKQKYVLFCASWLREGKGIYAAIRAYSMSGLSALGIRLKVVGNASEDVSKQMHSLTAQYKCADMVDFLPAQKDVKQLFANAMAYINPSVKEGMGRTTAEAMFLGCPVVAGASGGTLDLIKHGDTGWLFNTEEECAELLNIVCNTDQEQIILQAQEFARRNLSIENYGDKIIEVYKKVLNN